MWTYFAVILKSPDFVLNGTKQTSMCITKCNMVDNIKMTGWLY